MQTIQEYEDHVSETARVAITVMNAQPFYRAYLYYRPADGPQAGSLIVVADGQDAPPGCELATGARIPPNRTVAGVRAWIRDLTGRLPLLATEDA